MCGLPAPPGSPQRLPPPPGSSPPPPRPFTESCPGRPVCGSEGLWLARRPSEPQAGRPGHDSTEACAPHPEMAPLSAVMITFIVGVQPYRRTWASMLPLSAIMLTFIVGVLNVDTLSCNAQSDYWRATRSQNMRLNVATLSCTDHFHDWRATLSQIHSQLHCSV